jgi:hypothetical protein
MGRLRREIRTGLRQPRRVSAVYAAGRARDLISKCEESVTSGRQAFVAMVQATQLGDCDNLAVFRTMH